MSFNRLRPPVRNLLASKLKPPPRASRDLRDSPEPSRGIGSALKPSLDPAPDLRRRASEAQADRDWTSACDLWQAAVEADPGHAGSWVQFGNMLNELERRQDAIQAFRQAGAVDPALADAPAGIAGVHERDGRWSDALAAWLETIPLLPRNAGAAALERLSHAYGHAVMTARLSGQVGKAFDLLMGAAEAVPTFHSEVRHFLVRAQVLKEGNPVRALELLHDYLAQFPGDEAARYEVASISLATGGYEAGLATLMPALDGRGSDLSFLRLAADLNERLGRWTEVQELSERMAALSPGKPGYLERAFFAASKAARLSAARRIARLYTQRFNGELALLHRLMRAYEDAGELHHARLLSRWLSRQWPHSRWHVKRYITLTAATRSLPDADRLVRAEIAAGRRDAEVEQAYCDAAVHAGDNAEARRRLESYLLRHPDDHGMQVMLGYVLANAADIDTAERHFAGLASRTFQDKDALTGLAHMAMRRRDTPATHERWSRLATLYPEDTIGFVEYARSAYELRLPGLARQICEDRLRALPGDVTMGEFYAWLLAALGRFQEAWDYLGALRHRTGPSWAVAELSVQCAAFTGVLDEAAPAILATIPTAESREDGRRLYHVVRQLVVADRPLLLPAAVARTGVPARRLPWMEPYLAARPQHGLMPAFVEGVHASWQRTRDAVSDATARRVRAMSDAEVAALLSRPAFQQPLVHIVNKFEQMRGGSELHALDVADRIGRYAKVQLWAPEMPHPHFSRDHGVKAVDTGRGLVPRGGTLVLIGVYFGIESWIGRTHPSRVAILYNTFEAPLLFERIEEIHARTGVRPELIFCSDLMQQECGLPGHFEPSPTDINLFTPSPPRTPGARPFTVGRHSRDVVEKHHPDDWKIYAAAAAAGGSVQVLGGTCMASAFPVQPGVELLPARNQGIPEFLQSLDAFVYRTSTWVEPWGRVVIEAMACGLPVLVHERGGYAQAIRHETNGLLFRTTEDAERLMRRLAAEPALCDRLGREARQSAEAMLGQEAMARLVAFYLADA